MTRRRSRSGTTIFTDYTYTESPKATDADGNAFNPSAFNLTRAYINITGNISHLVAFRVTPDIARETGAGSSLSGSLEFRVKYTFAQVNLDEWMGTGTWVRLGIQQTPWLDYAEGIYRYRFQGTMFAEREGYFASADAGASFHYSLPSNYGEFHVGYYNGENYNKAEVNNQKALMMRGTVRPFAKGAPLLRGLRASLFYDTDHYVKNDERQRFIANATFEHRYVNAGAEFLDTHDQTLASVASVPGRGYSLWATPKSSMGLEGLLRFDHLTPNTNAAGQVRQRTIVGLAYWFPHKGTVSSSMMLDYDGQTFDGFAFQLPAQRKIALHALVNF